MTADEKAIRTLVADWFAATKAGDVPAVLRLIDDEALFLTPGRAPFGKDAFAAASAGMKDLQFEGTSEIEELSVHGNWAWMRSRLRVVVTPPGGRPLVRTGRVLTILRKLDSGAWVVHRDANLLAPETAPD